MVQLGLPDLGSKICPFYSKFTVLSTVPHCFVFVGTPYMNYPEKVTAAFKTVSLGTWVLSFKPLTQVGNKLCYVFKHIETLFNVVMISLSLQARGLIKQCNVQELLLVLILNKYFFFAHLTHSAWLLYQMEFNFF